MLGRDGLDGLYCYPALDRPAIDAGGNALLAEIEALIAALSRRIRTSASSFALALYGTSETPEDRRRGPGDVHRDALKSHAGITEAVAFVGLGHKFQIWEPGRFRAKLRGGHREGRALKKQLSSRVAARRRALSTGMMAGRGGSAVAGGPARHIPVLAPPGCGASRCPRRRRLYRRRRFGAGGCYARAFWRRRLHGDRHRPRSQTAIARRRRIWSSRRRAG